MGLELFGLDYLSEQPLQGLVKLDLVPEVDSRFLVFFPLLLTDPTSLELILLVIEESKPESKFLEHGVGFQSRAVEHLLFNLVGDGVTDVVGLGFCDNSFEEQVLSIDDFFYV